MAETAEGGGCLTVDVGDPDILRDALVALATQPNLRRTLLDEIEKRRLKTWADYASEVRDALASADL
jgi:hypothetical protein